MTWWSYIVLCCFGLISWYWQQNVKLFIGYFLSLNSRNSRNIHVKIQYGNDRHIFFFKKISLWISMTKYTIAITCNYRNMTTLNPSSTGDTLSCSRICKHARHINMHAVSRKRFFKICFRCYYFKLVILQRVKRDDF